MNETTSSEPNTSPARGSLRARLLGGQLLAGSFVKTPGASAIEILGGAGLDFIVVDEEHAPFDRAAIDLAMLAAKATGVAALVRVGSLASALSALDLGATGVLVPHVHSVELARQVAAACRYQGTGERLQRGFTNATRAGGYGSQALMAHVRHSDRHTVVMAMIEDPQALDDIDAIAAVPGVDAFFIGRGDLTVALGATDPGDARVRAAVARICDAVRKAGKPLCAMVAQLDDIPALQALGITAFIVGSDQGLLRQSALQVVSGFAAMAGAASPSSPR